MPATVAATLAAVAAIRTLFAEVGLIDVTVAYVDPDEIRFSEVTEDGVTLHDFYSVAEAEDIALDLAVLGEAVQADPEPYHPDTRAAYGIAHYERITLIAIDDIGLVEG